MPTLKQYIPTGTAAKLMMVCPATIISLYERGLLKGFQVPMSRYRKIETKSVLALMDANGYAAPTEAVLRKLGIVQKEPNEPQRIS